MSDLENNEQELNLDAMQNAQEVQYELADNGDVIIPLSGGGSYKRPTCTLEKLINEFVVGYSCAAIKRTAPYGGSAPIGITKLLQAVVTTCGKKNEPQMSGNIIGNLEKYYKTNEGTHDNLCRLSAQPFPLVQTGKLPDKNADVFELMPLYDEATGKYAATRYSNVCLSALGKIAFKDSYDIPIEKIKSHKGIVPLALLRKGLSWTLGHHSVMYPLNPKEIFQLQERMLELNTPFLPTEIVMGIFRGPDLGPYYNIYMTNESIASLYASGTGSMMVVPEIRIDRFNSQVIFERTALDKVGSDFALHLTRRLRGGKISDSEGVVKDYKKFKTLDLDLNGQGVFISGTNIVADVVFLTNDDQEIIDELHSDPDIYQNIPIQNILLKTKDGSYLQTDEEDLDSTADFDIDVTPIYEVLWDHIMQEIEVKKINYQTEYNQLQARLKWDLFLEKVTRPEVSKAIMKIWADTNNEDASYERRKRLEEMFLYEDTRDKDLLPEGFDSEEIAEINRTTTANSKTGKVIINIMSQRNKYSSLWESTTNRIKELEYILNDEQNVYIREEIRKALNNYTNNSEFDRKSKVYFIEPLGTSASDEVQIMIPNDEVWKNHYLPCSVYYNKSKLVKSYGRNINILPNTDGDTPESFTDVINCTTYDTLIVYGYSQSQTKLISVRDLPCEPISLGHDIKAMIPYPRQGEKILLLINKITYSQSAKTYLPVQSIYYILDGDDLQIPQLNKNDYIVSYAYLDKKYIQAIGLFAPALTEIGLTHYTTEDIINTIPHNDFFIRDNDNVIMDIVSCDEDPITYKVNRANQADYAVVKYSDSTLKRNELISANSIFNKIAMTMFTTHLECYTGETFIPWWADSFIMSIQEFPHSKLMVLPEPHYCRPRDLTSTKFKTNLTTKLRKSLRTLRCINSRSTSGYDNYVISQLDDWSLIDPRYRLPINRPTKDEALIAFNDFFKELNECTMTETRYGKLERKIKDYRTVGVSNTNSEPTEQIEDSFKSIPMTAFGDEDDDSDDMIQLDD